MKQYILLLVLMVMGAGMTVHAEDVNPVKVGKCRFPVIMRLLHPFLGYQQALVVCNGHIPATIQTEHTLRMQHAGKSRENQKAEKSFHLVCF